MTSNHRMYAVVLGLLALAFFMRVAGQAVVAAGEGAFLPPMEQWYLGLLPYPVLLPIQIVILIVQAMIFRDLWRGRGVFAKPWPKLGRGLMWFAYFYAAAMVLRYIVTMSLYPDQRWFSGTIPIFFHFVLAAYIFVFGQYHCRSMGAKP